MDNILSYNESRIGRRVVIINLFYIFSLVEDTFFLVILEAGVRGGTNWITGVRGGL